MSAKQQGVHPNHAANEVYVGILDRTGAWSLTPHHCLRVATQLRSDKTLHAVATVFTLPRAQHAAPPMWGKQKIDFPQDGMATVPFGRRST